MYSGTFRPITIPNSFLACFSRRLRLPDLLRTDNWEIGTHKKPCSLVPFKLYLHVLPVLSISSKLLYSEIVTITFLVLAATLQIIAFCYRLLQQDTYATKRLVECLININNCQKLKQIRLIIGDIGRDQFHESDKRNAEVPSQCYGYTTSFTFNSVIECLSQLLATTS